MTEKILFAGFLIGAYYAISTIRRTQTSSPYNHQRIRTRASVTGVRG